MILLQIFSSNSFLLIVGFILTTVFGGLITYYFQKLNWKRQSYLDLYKKTFEDGTSFLNELSVLIGKRFFLLQKLMWAINDNNEERISKTELDYFSIVNEWNFNLYKTRNNIRLILDEGFANLFLDYTDDYRVEGPISIHYKFVATHRKMMNAKKNKDQIKDAELLVKELNKSCIQFIEKVTTEFKKRSLRLSLLNF